MNSASIFILKSLRHMYAKVFGAATQKPACIMDLDVASSMIRDGLNGDAPFMVARLGATEATCLANYRGITNGRSLRGYLTGQADPWWWNASVLRQMEKWSGFFPATEKNAERFCKLMQDCMEHVDILGSWLPQEMLFEKELRRAKKVELHLLNPFFAEAPWTHALAGKRVLVVHPFAETIKKQYAIREKIFPDGLLPEFELHVLRAVQSLGGKCDQFDDWFHALESMKEGVEKVDCDICIIGCGAYGFPLAAHVKSKGKKSLHLGGVTQLLFGIRGKRWDNYAVYPYENLYNESWVRPRSEERPISAQEVEGGCYW